MSDNGGELDLRSLDDDELVKQMQDDLYDGLKPEVEEGVHILLERGWTPASTILDIPTTFQTREGRPYTPQNYDRAYHGPLALREALATS